MPKNAIPPPFLFICLFELLALLAYFQGGGVVVVRGGVSPRSGRARLHGTTHQKYPKNQIYLTRH